MSFKHIFISVMLPLIFHANVLSQQCDMHEVPYITTGFNDSVKLKWIYDSISNDMSGNFTFLLINTYGQVRRRKAYVLTVDSTGFIRCSYEMIEDMSGLVCKKVTVTRKFNSLPYDTLRSALFLGSSSISNTHMSSILLVSNKKRGIRLEYHDLDGDVHSCIQKSPAPSLMKYAAETLEYIFKSSLKS